MNKENTFKLGAEFPDASAEDWRALAEKSLKGKSFEDSLFETTYDGIIVNPLYTSADWAPGKTGSVGLARIFDDDLSTGNQKCPWKVCQRFSNSDVRAANKEILRDLKGGVHAIELVFDAAAQKGRPNDGALDVELIGKGGIALHASGDLQKLLESVHLEMIEVSLQAGMSSPSAAAGMLALYKSTGVKSDNARLLCGMDPLGAFAIGGHWAGAEKALATGAEFASSHRSEFRNLVCFRADTTPYHNGGASNVQELGFALATGVSYLRALVDSGLSIEDSFGQIDFAVSVDADLFGSASKIRALRRLWARVSEASFGGAAPTSIQARTSHRMLTRFDPWVNILRNVTAGFAGALGGADRITIEPFDLLDGGNSELGRRVARNTHIILAEETMLGSVADPAGGSWYVESFTDELAERAWALFQDIEKMGGMGRALSSGFVGEQVAVTREQRQRNVATRVQATIGVSEFPNILEDITSEQNRVDDAYVGQVGRRFSDELTVNGASENSDTGQNGLLFLSQLEASTEQIANPIEPFRDGAAFERLRDASDRVKGQSGQRPTIFLGNWGTPADFTARSTFAKNFFEAGGIQAISNDGFSDAAEMASAFRESGCSLFVLCSTDAQYEHAGVSIVDALKAENPKAIFVAGNPKNKADLTNAGVDTFISMGMNVLDVLEKAYEVLRVEI